MLPALALRPDLRVILPPRRRSAAAASSCSRFRWLQQSGPVPAPPHGHGPGPVSSSAAGCSARAAAGRSSRAPGGARRPGAGSAGPAGSAAAGAGGRPQKGKRMGLGVPAQAASAAARSFASLPAWGLFARGMERKVSAGDSPWPVAAPGRARALAELSAHARPGGQRDPAGGAAAPLTPAHVVAKHRAGGWI